MRITLADIGQFQARDAACDGRGDNEIDYPPAEPNLTCAGHGALGGDRQSRAAEGKPRRYGRQGQSVRGGRRRLRRFYLRGGSYWIVATKGTLTQTWRYVPIGTAQEVDIEAVHAYSGMRYLRSIATGDDAAAGTLRGNNANLTGATILYFAAEDADGTTKATASRPSATARRTFVASSICGSSPPAARSRSASRAPPSICALRRP